MYRKMKTEQEIEGLLWRINPDCLQGYRYMVTFGYLFYDAHF